VIVGREFIEGRRIERRAGVMGSHRGSDGALRCSCLLLLLRWFRGLASQPAAGSRFSHCAADTKRNEISIGNQLAIAKDPRKVEDGWMDGWNGG